MWVLFSRTLLFFIFLLFFFFSHTVVWHVHSTEQSRQRLDAASEKKNKKKGKQTQERKENEKNGNRQEGRNAKTRSKTSNIQSFSRIRTSWFNRAIKTTTWRSCRLLWFIEMFQCALIKKNNERKKKKTKEEKNYKKSHLNKRLKKRNTK